MADVDRIWEIEKQLWLGGAEVYAEHLADGCIMVFPEPVGILVGQAIIQSLEGAPRWAAVDTAHETAFVIDRDTLVIAYRASGQREGDTPYRALCSSTYSRQGERWTIALHQQTPIAES